MIGPVSGTGRAMMASLQQAMQQGMPPDQAIAYVKSMAQQGVAPLVDLYSMLNQFQRLKQPQAQAPQTPPTIKDQINMAAQQQAMQQAQQQAMMQGLGGMNAGAMENPQFAGGGIIAFQEGGQPPASSGLQGLLDLINKRFGQDETAYAEAEAERRRALREKMKLGEYGQAAAERQKDLEEQDKARGRYEQELKRANMLEYFAELGRQSSQPGATFMGSLAAAGETLGKGRKEAAKELRDMDAMRREARLKLLEAQELRREGDIAGAQKAYAEGQDLVLELQQKNWELGEARTTAIAQARAQQSDVSKIQGELLGRMSDMQRRGMADTPEFKQLQNLYQSSFPQVAAAQARSFNQAPQMLQKEWHAANTARLKVISEGYNKTDPNRIEIEEIFREVNERLKASGYAPPTDAELRSLQAQGAALPEGFKLDSN